MIAKAAAAVNNQPSSFVSGEECSRDNTPIVVNFRKERLSVNSSKLSNSEEEEEEEKFAGRTPLKLRTAKRL